MKSIAPPDRFGRAKSEGRVPLWGGLQEHLDHLLSWKVGKCSCYGEMQWWPCRLCLIQALQILKREDKWDRPCGKWEKKATNPQLGPWWIVTREPAISWLNSLSKRGFLCVSVFLLFLSNWSFLLWHGHSAHTTEFVFLGALMLALYPILSRSFISRGFLPRFQFGLQVRRLLDGKNDRDMMISQAFFLSKTGQKYVYLCILSGIQTWLR